MVGTDSLIDIHGNGGSRDHPAASATYTEARLAPAGELALEAEAGGLAPVPIGLINGDAHRDGLRPPLDPERVITALLHLKERPRTTDAELADLVGPPRFAAMSEIDVDLPRLYAGKSVAAAVHARIRRTRDDPLTVVINRVPPNSSPAEALEALAKAARRDPIIADTWPELDDSVRLPIETVIDTRTFRGDQITCTAAAGTTFEQLVIGLRSLWPLSQWCSFELPAALPKMLRSWLRDANVEDTTTSLQLLRRALPRR